MIKFILTFLLCFSVANAGELVQPKTNADFKKTSVRILNVEMTGGGTGVIFRSYESGSHILTNKHVCKVIEQGGYVATSKKRHPITHYKKFPTHDLCLVRIATDLKVNTKLEEGIAKPTKTSYVSGHPNLLPHIVTKGHLSDHMSINLMVGLRECTKKEFIQEPLLCGWMGGFPVVESFPAQVTSNLIQPGSSGSAVFNDKGNIVGVAFAGSGDLSFSFIVPHIYVAYFLSNSTRFDWVKTGTPVDDGGLKGRIFNYNYCKDTSFKVIKRLCRLTKSNMLWNKVK